MAQNTLYDFSTTAGSNTDIASISVAEGWLPSTVNNYERAWMAIVRKDLNDKGGVVTVGGTANAITITSSSPATYQSLVSGIRIRFKAASSNSAATTLNLDALGAKAVRKLVNAADAALAAGDIVAGISYDAVYDSTANAAAGAWIISPSKQYAPDGTAPLPSMAFDQDTNTGFYRISADRVGLALGGTLAVDFASTTNMILATDASFVTLGAYNLSGSAALGGLSATKFTTTGALVAAAGIDITGSFGSGAQTVGAGRIFFPASQNASSDANTLDDYEEGTWTPTIQFGGAAVGVTYGTQSGTYTKVGNVVTITCNLVLTAKGSSTGAAVILGLPFTASPTGIATGWVNAGVFTGLTAGVGALVNTTSVSLRQNTTTGASNVLDTNMAATSSMTFSLSYLTAT